MKAEQPLLIPPRCSLDNYLDRLLNSDPDGPDLQQTLLALAAAATELSCKIGQNFVLDLQNPIELLAFSLFEQHLQQAPVRLFISEKFERPQRIDQTSDLAVTIHPLESAANIALSMPCGSLFAVHRVDADLEGISGRSQIAAGYFIYGPQTLLALSCGDGTALFALDRNRGSFELLREQLQVPDLNREFAIDTSNYRFWDSRIRHYFDDCVSGSDGPLGVDYDLCWCHSLVAEANRILMTGGLYLYPDDTRPGFETGKHKLLYEALPIAFLIEQAGGKASDGFEAILDKPVNRLDARVALIFGATEAVDQLLDYYTGDASETTRFPLFENRSLFRN